MEKVRWGILSTADIAVEEVIPALQQGSGCKVAAIASRSREKASRAADRLGIETAVGSYEELLAHPGVEAVYNPLPNHLHVEWSAKALKAGKHVLCEKPLGQNLADARRLAEEAKKYPELKVMEAFMYRHHPRWKKVQSLIGEGAIGKVRSVQSFFSYYNDNPDDIRNNPEMGGGSLLDVGCYCISVPRFIFGAEPVRAFGFMEQDPEFQIDRLTSGVLDFPGGRASFTCATQLALQQSVTISGTEGYIELPWPFNPPTDRPTTIHLHTGEGSRDISIPSCNQYTLQGDLFSGAIRLQEEVPLKLEDALANMRVIDAIKRSSAADAWVNC